MVKYAMKRGDSLFAEEKRGVKLTRHLLLFFLVNLLILSIVIAYSEITAALLARGESVCSFYKTFRIYCPGCGGSRSLLSLVRFDFLSSFLFFPALIPSVIIFLCFDFLVLISILKQSSAPLKRFPMQIIILIPVLILLNFAVRNLLLFLGIDYISLLT